MAAETFKKRGKRDGKRYPQTNVLGKFVQSEKHYFSTAANR